MGDERCMIECVYGDTTTLKIFYIFIIIYKTVAH
jgi:hypothetical protein